MKKLLFLLLISQALWAEFEWPPEQVPVRIDGQLVPVVWREGRPFVEREQVLPVLHIRSGPDQLDLAETLQQRGYTIQMQADGSIDCRKPLAKSSASAGQPMAARRTSRRSPSADQHQREWRDQQRRQAQAPRLEVSGYRYVAETDFIRAFCVVRNLGATPSPACTAIGEFVDWYGRPFAQDTCALPSLQPGESAEVTFFSMVHKDETQPNGVIKADKYTCKVSFDGLSMSDTPRSNSPRRAYQPSSSKRTTKSSNFRIDSSTTKFTPGNANLPSGTTIDANGYPRSNP